MKRPVLLAVEETAASYAELLAALTAAGERSGWLDLGAAGMATPPPLEEAAAAGVLRAVAVGDGRVSSLKPIQGTAVLDDLLREHFRGCRLVLVRGGRNLVELRREAAGWRLQTATGQAVRQSTEELVASLRRPSFWVRLEGRAAGDDD